ncbi:uncharacterized protein JCM10292_001659 [Rhodotorula paludigena]|uniref:uncharacterized protein n=1 Tax=Rhodotorula paludigena TaxID=86838 RepID=UPI00318237C4
MSSSALINRRQEAKPCTFEEQLRLAVDLAAATGVAYFRSGLVEPPDLFPEFLRRGWEGIGFAHFKPDLIKVSRIDAADDHSAEELVYSLQIIDVHSNEQRKRVTEREKLKLHLYRYFLSLIFDGADFRLSPDLARIRLSDTLASWIYTGCYTSECNLPSCVLNQPRLDPDAKPVPPTYLAVLNNFVDSQVEREVPYNQAWVEKVLYEEFPLVEGWKRLSLQGEPEDNGDDVPDIGGEGPFPADDKPEGAGQPLDNVDDDDDKKDLVRVKSEELTVDEAVNAVLPVTPTRQAPIKQETQEEVVDHPEQAVELVTEEKKVVFDEEEHAARRRPCLRPRKRALS